jgi:putative ABC transport system permease protein
LIRLPLVPAADARAAAPASGSTSGSTSGSDTSRSTGDPPGVPVRVRGIWRDYARQFGAIAIDAADYQRLTGDARVNDLALWLKAGAAPAEVEAALRRAAGPDLPLELASTASLRALSLRIFDRSFAVTFYLQAVAVAVGLVGVAASLSAQVLARRKEFGLLAHLGLTRRQVIALVGAEAAAWLLAGSLIGLALGVAMAMVLVFVVNPQSFHWTMPLLLPLPRLAALAGAVLTAGIATALWSARRAAGRSAVLAVKEDW